MPVRKVLFSDISFFYSKYVVFVENGLCLRGLFRFAFFPQVHVKSNSGVLDVLFLFVTVFSKLNFTSNSRVLDCALRFIFSAGVHSKSNSRVLDFVSPFVFPGGFILSRSRRCSILFCVRVFPWCFISG